MLLPLWVSPRAARPRFATVANVWYWAEMKRKTGPSRRAPDVVYNTHALTETSFNLLTKLIHWLADNEQRKEKLETKYRAAMAQKLARIESMVSLIWVGQSAQTQSNPPWYQEDKLRKDAESAEEFISRQAHENGSKMIRFIYGEDKTPQPEPHHDRRRKWSGWEI